MQYSVVQYNKVKSDSDCVRIDAEFFKEEYLSIDSLLRQKTHKDLKDFGIKIYHPNEIKREYTELGGVLFLRAQNVRPLEIDLDSNRVYISEDDAKKLSRNYILNTDVLITRTGANFGQCAIYLEKEEAIASSHTFIVRTSILNPFFLAVFLNTTYGRKLIDKGMYGATQPEIAPFYLYRIPVPLLKDDFYKTIEKIYRKSFDYGIQAKTLYAQSERILLSELKLFDWKPKLQPSFIKNYSDTQSAERIDAEYFQPKYEEIVTAIKSATSYKPLGGIVSIKKCIEPGSEEYQESGIPFLRVSNLSKFGINHDNQRFLHESLYETFKSHQPKKGEILLSKDATPGIAYYLKDEPVKMIPSSGILRLTIQDTKRIQPEYFTLVLNSIVVQKQIERDVGGSIINHWLVDMVKNTLIPVLSGTIQENISDKINESFMAREQSKRLLDIAKQGVEMAIEKDEKQAENWINSELKKLNITLK
jgi:restriction endonuclease S subunit